MQASMEISYEDFEPFCKWKRDENSDTLEVHLPGFKRQQLKVQVSSSGTLVITGERRKDEEKSKRISRFKKEFPVPEDFQPAQIQAKFSNGILYLVIPKRISTISPPAAAAAAAAVAGGGGGENVKAAGTDSRVSSLMNLKKRVAFEIMILAILLGIVGVYVNKYCHCSCLE